MRHSLVLHSVSTVLTTLFMLVVFTFPFESARSQTESTKSPVQAQLLADTKKVEAGKPFRLSVLLKLEPGWHVYYKDAGDAGLPTQVNWRLPQGFTAEQLEWETPETFKDSGIVTRGYKDKTTISAVIHPPKIISSRAVELAADVKWLSCKNACVPGHASVSTSLPVASVANSSPLTLSSSDLPKTDDSQNLLLYLVFAFTGGIILNFMPCVLPVIAIKLMSLLEHSAGGTQRTRLLGATFASGILVSFAFMALIVIALKAAGQQVGWGFQFQYPGFLIAMSAIVTLMALSLFGMFYVSVPTGQAKLDQLANQEGIAGTFFKGVLATTLSTPCTAPFLGAALGFAFAQPWWIVLSIFMAIGVGMALPYLVLTTKPEWLSFLPKPGAWMEKLKESMGFVLLATVVWLLYVLATEVGAIGTVLTVGFLVALALCSWIVSRFTDLSSGALRKGVVWSLAIAIGGLSFYALIGHQWDQFAIGQTSTDVKREAHADSNEIVWKSFDPDALNEELAQGKTVFLDFTADWCLTCKVNETTILASKAVKDKLKTAHIVTMRADWTKQSPAITNMLNKFHRSGVPLYVIFPGTGKTEPIVLPEILTEAVLLEKLSESVAPEEI